MSLTLRRMKPRDVPVVAAIDRLSFPTPWPAAAFRRELEREQATYLVLLESPDATLDTRSSPKESWLRRLVGAEESSVVGYVGFRVQEGGGHITTIAVHPDRRGQGLGDFLLLVALQRMIEHDVGVVTLEMRPSNHVAYRLYRKHGFRIRRLKRRYYRDGEDAWLMAVSIDDRDYQRRLVELRDWVDERLTRQGMEVGQITGEAL